MRLLSYNIHKGVGGLDRAYRPERIADVIAEAEADLVCLQEVTRHARRTRYDDQPRYLARGFEARASSFQMNVRYRVGGYGNLLLSRWPIRARNLVSLRMGRRKPRGAQLVIVETPEGPLHLINWHLGLSEKERHWQVGHLLQHPLFRESGHLPTLIVGDFNDWRNTLGDGPFAEHGFAHATESPSRFRSFPAYFPVLALDKAFHRGGVVVGGAEVMRSSLARRASDHLPLVVDFQLRPSASGTPPPE
jgi:endonuclease/exonuclease/phosphatase family metal-dependent hydrolase